MEADDLDDILDSALDELDDGDEEEEGSQKEASERGNTVPGRAAGTQEAATVNGGTEREGGKGAEEGADSSKEQAGPSAAAELTADEKELQETIAKTIEMLGRVDEGEGGDGVLNGEGALFDEAFLNELASEFERLGQTMGGTEGGGEGGAAADGVVDDMVKQLLCKDLMYPPIKQVTDAFPAWLARPESQRDAKEYGRYKEQYALFQEIVRVYESDEGNMNLLLELMTKAQDYGQPPREVLEELVPGGLGSNGLPLPPGMTEGGEPCSIM